MGGRAPAEGPRGGGKGGRRGAYTGVGTPPEDYSIIIQSPDGLNKAPKHYTKTQNIKQDPKILDKPKPFEHPKDLEVVPHPIIRNIHQTAPYSSSHLEN